jgi:ABC-type transporter Mla subunit MlaD
MRRLSLAIALATLAAAIALVVGATAQGSDSYRFDVIFDDARGLIAGQLVKIAGAQAGTISNVTVTPDYKARVAATVPGNFQFHTDATCTIRPQGLIAENYVDCDPGTSSAPLLRATGGQPPTVPVTHTTEPVSLQDLFNIFNVPTRERFQVLVDELGIGTAGEGDNLNDILRRANPALQLARRVTSILYRQQNSLKTIIDATGRIAAEGATHTGAVHDFITRARALTALTANHSSSLAQAVARLPGLLTAARPALSQLDVVARQGTPLLSSIRAATPALNRVNADIDPFAKLAGPALSAVNSAITAAIPAIRQTTPLTNAIANYAKLSAAKTGLFSRLSVNLQRRGFIENFLSVIYYVSSSLSRYDSVSHMLSILFVGPHNGQCGAYATSPVPACSAHYGQQKAYKPARRRLTRGSAPATTTAGSSATTTKPAASGPPAAGTTTNRAVHLPPVPAVPSRPGSAQNLQNLVNYLLR